MVLVPILYQSIQILCYKHRLGLCWYSQTQLTAEQR